MELLRAEGAQAVPQTLENLVTHRSKKLWLSLECPYLNNVRPYTQPRSQSLSPLPPLVVGKQTLFAAGHVNSG